MYVYTLLQYTSSSNSPLLTLICIGNRAANLPGKVLIAKLDVTLFSDWEALIADTVKAFGKIDVLVNNAGVMLLSKVLNLKVDEWMSMVDINIKGYVSFSLCLS